MNRIYLLLVGLLTCLYVGAEDKLTLSTAGNNISIGLDNETSFTAFQMDVIIPQGLTKTAVTPASRIASSLFEVDSEMIESNVLRVIGYNTDNQAISGNTGELVNITLASTLKTTDKVEVKNIRFVKTNNLSEMLLADVGIANEEPVTPEEPDDVNIDDTDISQYDNIIYVEPIDANAGENVVLSVKMKNAMNVSGFQMNFYAPDGCNLTKVARGTRTKAKDDDDEYIYTFQNSTYPDGSRYLLCYSTLNTPMAGNDGEIAQITLNIPETLEAGEYPIIIKAAEMSYGSDNAIVEYFKATLTVNDYIEGDANCDGRVSVTDITTIASYLLGNKPASFSEKAADANKDSRVSVTDITTIAQKLLEGGSTSYARNIIIE